MYHRGMEHPARGETPPAARLLVLVGRSRRNAATPGLLPAIERYDGPVFRLLRRFLRASDRPISIHILSAAYGLIPADHPIPWYDCQMTTERATALRPAVRESLRAVVNGDSYTESFICMGSTYRQALPDIATCIPATAPVEIAHGTIGRQLGMLHDWLYGQPPAIIWNVENTGKARIRGIELSVTADEAISTARFALAQGVGKPRTFQSWYVSVDDQQVAPKWLVSQLSGLPVRAFSADEARHVLAQIGVTVRRA